MAFGTADGRSLIDDDDLKLAEFLADADDDCSSTDLILLQLRSIAFGDWSQLERTPLAPTLPKGEAEVELALGWPQEFRLRCWSPSKVAILFGGELIRRWPSLLAAAAVGTSFGGWV